MSTWLSDLLGTIEATIKWTTARGGKHQNEIVAVVVVAGSANGSHNYQRRNLCDFNAFTHSLSLTQFLRSFCFFFRGDSHFFVSALRFDFGETEQRVVAHKMPSDSMKKCTFTNASATVSTVPARCQLPACRRDLNAHSVHWINHTT